MRRPLRARVGLLAALMTAILLAPLTVPASADDLDDQREQTEVRQRAVNEAMARLQEDLEHIGAELVRAYAELQGIQAALPIAEQQLAAAEAEHARLELEAALLAERLAAAEAEEEAITAQIEADAARGEAIQVAIGRMARDAYKGDLAASSFSAVLDAQSTEDFIAQSALAATAMRTQTHALRELEQINGVNRNRQARLAAVREQIAELKDAADAKVAEAEAARQRAADRKAELDQLLVDAQHHAAYIESQRAEQQAQQAKLDAERTALANELLRIIEEQNRQGNPGTLPDVNHPLSYPVPPPVVITSSYGWRIHPIYGDRRLHAGTDFRAYCGNPILAAASGTVQWAKMRGGYGNQVLINHGYWQGKSMMTSYNHLSQFAVSAGQAVTRGQVIGYSGTTGTSTACHLHFEVYLNGVTVNPMSYTG